MKILLLGYLGDNQSAIYVGEAFKELGHDVTAIATREIVAKFGNAEGQTKILEEIDKGNYSPDIVLVLKGIEVLPKTLKQIKERFPDATFINWFFDWLVAGVPIWKNESYFDTIKMFDYYFFSAGECVTKLKEKGFDNVYYLDEACSPLHHAEVYMNAFQKKKYSSDVSFIGTLGHFNIHPDRVKYLLKIAKEGFELRIWGRIAGEMKFIPMELRPLCTQQEVINQNHSKVVKTSLVNLGLDSNINLWRGQSARIFRVMCAGGLYLSAPTKGLDEMFKLNKKDEPITDDQEIVVFYDENDLVRKLDFLLEHDAIREKIAQNGQKKVLEEHKFVDRIKEMIKIIGDKK